MAELRLENVRYRYGKKSRWILTGCNAVCKEGTVTSIRGRSGSGGHVKIRLS